jgi:hypothetical protein
LRVNDRSCFDNAGIPIPGVSVLVKGTKFGTNTDFDGKYAIKASPSQILTLLYIENPINGSFFINCKYYNDWRCI